MQIHSVGIDLGKTTFHLVVLGAAGKVLVKKLNTLLNLGSCLCELLPAGRNKGLVI